MKVSVCMATYNGEAYLRQQIASILPQLAPDDELIVSDDCSHDGTAQIVASFADPRILWRTGTRRLGYVGNFERALSLARGELILLCDQDDIWLPDKVVRMKEALGAHSAAAMVHHEREIVDAKGLHLSEGPRLGEGVRGGLPFLMREAVKARIWGCALGIRREALDLMLPFPRAVYAHDHWATVVGGLAGGICFLPERLIQHRLHGRNVTPPKGLPFVRRIAVRLRFLAMLAHCAIRMAKRRCS